LSHQVTLQTYQFHNNCLLLYQLKSSCWICISNVILEYFSQNHQNRCIPNDYC
jgi:hypothetical protein